MWALLGVIQAPGAYALWHGPAAGVAFATVLWATEETRRKSETLDRWIWVGAGVISSLVVLVARFVEGPVPSREIVWRLIGGAAFGFWVRGIAQRQREEKKAQPRGPVRERSTDEIRADVVWATKGALVPAIVLTVFYAAIIVLAEMPFIGISMSIAVLWGSLLLGAPIVGLLRPKMVGPLGFAYVFSVAALPVGIVLAAIVASTLGMGIAVTAGFVLAGAFAGVMFYARGMMPPR
jgi:hypothetical protein